MAELLDRLDRVTELPSSSASKARGAALYFGEFARLLKAQPPGRGFDFTTRNRRPPRDPVNALLSFAYALLVKDCFSALLHRRLRPVPRLLPRRPSRQAVAGPRSHGGVPRRHRRLGRPDADQQPAS